jgi:hypothetical protein
MMKKLWFYRDTVGPIGNKFSPAEIVGTLAVLAGIALAIRAMFPIV